MNLIKIDTVAAEPGWELFEPTMALVDGHPRWTNFLKRNVIAWRLDHHQIGEWPEIYTFCVPVTLDGCPEDYESPWAVKVPNKQRWQIQDREDIFEIDALLKYFNAEYPPDL